MPLLAGKQFDPRTLLISAAVASLGAAQVPDCLIDQKLDNRSLPLKRRLALHTASGYVERKPSSRKNVHTDSLLEWLARAEPTSAARRRSRSEFFNRVQLPIASPS